MNALQSFTRIIPAGGWDMLPTPGRVLSVKTSTLPITVAMDGGGNQPILSGSVINGPFRYLNFFNSNAVPVTVTGFVGDSRVEFSPQDNSQSLAQTYALGDLGVVPNSPAAGGLPACDTNGFLLITNNMTLLVSGKNNGHRRQYITFSMSANSPAPLNVLDANGCVCMTLAAGQQVGLPVDSDFVLSGANGTAWVSVGQIFLSA